MCTSGRSIKYSNRNSTAFGRQISRYVSAHGVRINLKLTSRSALRFGDLDERRRKNCRFRRRGSHINFIEATCGSHQPAGIYPAVNRQEQPGSLG